MCLTCHIILGHVIKTISVYKVKTVDVEGSRKCATTEEAEDPVQYIYYHYHHEQ